MRDRLCIVVLGYIVRCPVGGMAWSHLMYLLGLAQLGHDVWFLEDSGDHAYGCYDPIAGTNGADPTTGLAFAADAFGRLGLGERWAYHDALTGRWHGPAAEDMPSVLRRADMVLNVGGANPLRPWTEAVPVRVLIDQDPVFTQVAHLTQPARRAEALKHTAFFTFGENVGGADCTIPDDGLPWQPTRHPVVLAEWPVQPPAPAAPFTTVMQWQSYPPAEYQGRRYGTKAAALPAFLSVPARVAGPFEIAMGGSGYPAETIAAAGWRLVNGLGVSTDPWVYRRYIQASRGEFAVAKQGYVTTGSGWFSERSACYLASGRPVIVQDTAFGAWLKADAGVLSFADADEAAAAIAAVTGNYARHARAARAVAEEWFAPAKVLAPLIERAFSRPVPRVPQPSGEAAASATG